MTSWSFICSAASDGGVSYGLNVKWGEWTPGTPVITWGWQGGADNELWSISDDGSVLCALGSGLYLAPDSSNSGVVTSTAPYYWTFNEDGSIATIDGLLLTTDPSQSLAGAQLSLASPQGGQPASQQWWAAPNMQAVAQTFSAWRWITSTVTDTNNSMYALADSGTSQQFGANAVVTAVAVETNASAIMWQITSDGRILSALNRALLLGISLGGDPANPVVTQSGASPDNTQNWSFDASSGQVANPANSLYLGIDGNPGSLSPGESPQVLASTLPGGTAPPCFLWQLIPNSPLPVIVAMSPTPFPPFTGDTLSAYTYMCDQVGATPDIRSNYTNLSVDLSDWKSSIDQMSVPTGYDPAAWSAVVTELDSEITAADSVRAYFGQYNTYIQNLSAQCSNSLNQLGTLAGLEQGSQTRVGGLILSIFEGILYAALEAVPGGAEAVSLASVIGNVMEGSVNIATNAANVKTPISPNPFQVAYADLWGLLGGSLSATTDASGLMQTIILSDYGKSQAFYTASMAGGPNTLAWPAEQTSTLADNSLPGFELSVLKMLLPAKFQIYLYADTDDSPVDGVPSAAQWVTATASGLWLKFWIGAQGSYEEYPDTDMLNTYLWNAGVPQSDVFLWLQRLELPDRRMDQQRRQPVRTRYRAHDHQQPDPEPAVGLGEHGRGQQSGLAVAQPADPRPLSVELFADRGGRARTGPHRELRGHRSL